MRKDPASIRARAVALFHEAGITSSTLDAFDANSLLRKASDIVATLTREFGKDVVFDFVNASFSPQGIASMLAVGSRARADRRGKRG